MLQNAEDSNEQGETTELDTPSGKKLQSDKDDGEIALTTEKAAAAGEKSIDVISAPAEGSSPKKMTLKENKTPQGKTSSTTVITLADIELDDDFDCDGDYLIEADVEDFDEDNNGVSPMEHDFDDDIKEDDDIDEEALLTSMDKAGTSQQKPLVTDKQNQIVSSTQQKKGNTGNPNLAENTQIKHGKTKPAVSHKSSAGDEKEKNAGHVSKRNDEQDRRSLLVKNFPSGVVTSDIKALSKDIKEVRLRIPAVVNRRKRRVIFAFLEFESEEIEKNYKLLDGAVMDGKVLIADYCGEKSTIFSRKPNQQFSGPDPLRLYVTGFGKYTREADLYKLFPQATEIRIPKRKKNNFPVGYAFASFSSEEICKAAHDKSQDVKLHGDSLVVLFAKKRNEG